MQITGFPISSATSADAPELIERFWYWRGASGRTYIHTVYEPSSCPPLPGAVYVGVKRSGPLRVALRVGRFTPFMGLPDLSGCNEVHVHLMAKGPEAAEMIKDDLLAAMVDRSETLGFAEKPQVSLAA